MTAADPPLGKRDVAVDASVDLRTGDMHYILLKAASFSNNADFDTTTFNTRFDCIVAQSIFSHARPDLAEKALMSCSKTLAVDGLMLATFIHPAAAVAMPHESRGWTYPGCISYFAQTIAHLAENANLAICELPWFHLRQSWYALAHVVEALPESDYFAHLTGAVLRGSRFANSLG